jgi:hypothetical protein
VSESSDDADRTRRGPPSVRIGCTSCGLEQDIALGDDLAVAAGIRHFFEIHVDCDTTIDLSAAEDWGLPSAGRTSRPSQRLAAHPASRRSPHPLSPPTQ